MQSLLLQELIELGVKKAEKWILNKLDDLTLFSIVFCINDWKLLTVNLFGAVTAHTGHNTAFVHKPFSRL